MFGNRKYIGLMFLFLWVGVWGCTTTSPTSGDVLRQKGGERFSTSQLKDLAGVWEYKEASAVYPLTFDQYGNGIYDWKQGRFTTKSLDNGLWKGTWHQQENDREGGFEMHLDPDLRSATGSWWYTRIEQDSDPLDPGGTFTLKKTSE